LLVFRLIGRVRRKLDHSVLVEDGEAHADRVFLGETRRLVAVLAVRADHQSPVLLHPVPLDPVPPLDPPTADEICDAHALLPSLRIVGWERAPSHPLVNASPPPGRTRPR